MLAQLLHFVTGLCLLGSLFLSVISVASHTWIEKTVNNRTYHLGLWKFCDMKQCMMSSRIEFIEGDLLEILRYVRILCGVGLFINLIALSYFTFDCLILSKKIHLVGITITIVISGCLQSSGMMLFRKRFKAPGYQVGWSQTLGWISALLLAVSFLASLYAIKNSSWKGERRHKRSFEGIMHYEQDYNH